MLSDQKKARVIDKFRAFFERFYGIGDADLSMHEEPSYNFDEGYAGSELALAGEESLENYNSNDTIKREVI